MEELLRIAGGITLGYAGWLTFSFVFNALWWWHFCRITKIKMGFLRTLIMVFVVPTIYIVFPYVIFSIWTAWKYDNSRKWENYQYFCVLTWRDRHTANEWFGERHIQLSPRARQLLAALINKVDTAQQKIKQALAAIANFSNKNGR
ncbi:MAG: hypothetical protein V1902_01220 [Candidatus Falkowbacteria bacterium]